MIGLEPFLWVAGGLHGLIAASNLAAAGSSATERRCRR